MKSGSAASFRSAAELPDRDDPDPTKTRSSPVPEPETAALRAVRNVRKLNDQISKIKSKADFAMTAKSNERDKIIAALSPEAQAIFVKFIPETK